MPLDDENGMSTLTFTDDMARIQRAVAQCHDIMLRQSLVLEALQLRTGERVLEVGCGGGFYTYEVALCVGPTGQVCAIDRSADQIAAAQSRCAELPWVTCRVADAVALPYEGGEFDVVYGLQVFEYVESLDTALREVQRVLHPGGRCAILATDWHTVVWHSRHPKRMQRVLTAWGPTPPICPPPWGCDCGRSVWSCCGRRRCPSSTGPTMGTASVIGPPD